MKLHAQKGGASRKGISILYCAPSCLSVGRDPALKGWPAGDLPAGMTARDQTLHMGSQIFCAYG